MMGTAILSLLGSLIPRIFPDKDSQEKAKLEMAKMALDGQLKELEAEMKLNIAQIEVNKVQAASDNWFNSYPRPAAMWVCMIAMVLGLLSKVVLPAILIILPLFGSFDLSEIKSVVNELNLLPTEIYTTFLAGLLGLGAMRSYDKKIGMK